jgi:hypothetical protein
MPDTRAAATAATPTPTSPTSRPLAATVCDVVELLERYAAADRELAEAMDRIGAEVSSSRRVSQATVSRLVSLLDTSLVPGVRAKADLDALPRGLRRAGIAAWVRQATDRLAPRRIEGTA